MEINTLKKIVCAGGLFLARDTRRFLFLQRAEGKTAGTWGFVGGKQEPTDKTALDILTREINEEIGKTPPIKKIIPLEMFTSADEMFCYNTYVVLVEHEFSPVLNHEHHGYAWCNYMYWPKPLHRGVKMCITSRINKSKIETILDCI